MKARVSISTPPDTEACFCFALGLEFEKLILTYSESRPWPGFELM